MNGLLERWKYNGSQSYDRRLKRFVYSPASFSVRAFKLIKYNLYSEIISISIQSLQYVDGGY
jgi:hypothetical protein